MLHPRTIQKWDKQDRIKVVRTLGGRMIPESEIRRLQGEIGVRKEHDRVYEGLFNDPKG